MRASVYVEYLMGAAYTVFALVICECAKVRQLVVWAMKSFQKFNKLW